MEHPGRFILMGAFAVLWGPWVWRKGFWFRGRRIAGKTAKMTGLTISVIGVFVQGWIVAHWIH